MVRVEESPNLNNVKGLIKEVIGKGFKVSKGCCYVRINERKLFGKSEEIASVSIPGEKIFLKSRNSHQLAQEIRKEYNTRFGVVLSIEENYI